MSHQISFTTKKFDASKEMPNPHNPIAGEGVLAWLRAELVKLGWEVSQPDAEDWGWYLLATQGGAAYLVGASGEMDGEVPPTDWIVQIERQRSFMEKLMGKNKLTERDPLSGAIEALLRGSAEFQNVVVERSV